MGLLTIKQVADRLQLSVSSVYDLCARRKLAHVRLGVGRGAIRIDEQALDDFIKQATVQPEEPVAPQPAMKKTRVTGFTNLDGDRLLAAWRRQGVLPGQPDERNAQSSASTCGPSAPPES